MRRQLPVVVMVGGGLMGQDGEQANALSIDYDTEHPCALAELRLCRWTKPWFSTSFSPGSAVETVDGTPLPTSYTHPLPIPLCLSLPPSLSPALWLWPVTWRRYASKGAAGTMQEASQPGIWRALLVFIERILSCALDNLSWGQRRTSQWGTQVGSHSSDWAKKTSFLIFFSVKEPIKWISLPNEMTIPYRPPETDQSVPLMSSFMKTAFGMLVLMSAAVLLYCEMYFFY